MANHYHKRGDPTEDFAKRITDLGFVVYIAERGGYGFVTDSAGTRVLSFSFNDGGSLSGNYGPPSTTSGTGWRMDESPWQLVTAEDVKRALYANPAPWAYRSGKGWSYLSTAEQYLKQYGLSSRFARYDPTH